MRLALLLAVALGAAMCVGATDKPERDFRVYKDPKIIEFYRQQHARQTLDFVLRKKAEYVPPRRMRMSIWDAFRMLDSIVDASDPDISQAQTLHAFQTAEALRAADMPRWMILTGLIHDAGKVLANMSEPQWAVVGDTFPVGCRWSDKIVLRDVGFDENPDRLDPRLQSEFGVYSPNVGLDNVHMSWGHDEYLYHVVKDYLPEEALFIIRYHSFYPLHSSGAYTHLLSDKDRRMLSWLQRFQKFDLYSKSDRDLDMRTLMPFYEELVSEFLPDMLTW